MPLLGNYNGAKMLDNQEDSFFKDFYNKPIYDVDGYYITVGQLGFFLNRRNGKKLFKEEHKDFVTYYNNCLVYNYISDSMKKNPKSATMYWDSDKEAVAFKFPSKGKIAKTLIDLGEIGNKDDNFWK